MIRSMTGFGQAACSVAGYKVYMDVKSVNHRYAETVVRLPREWIGYEEPLKKTVQQFIKRGRVDVFVTMEREGASAKQVTVDWTLVNAYANAAGQIRDKLGLSETLSLQQLLQLPDVIQFREERTGSDEETERQLKACLEEAVVRMTQMRENEGKHLASDLAERLAVLQQFHRDITLKAPRVVEEYAVKLRQRIQELLSEEAALDEQRLAAEVAIYADRSNIDEELTRLDSHFKQFERLLQTDDAVGRKLDFLIQEMNREVNTIGSKAGHTEIVNKVIEMKAELEKMREQVQNIE